MTWLENLLIIAGILLDVFAAMEIQGAMIAKLKKRTIVVASAVVAASELVFYFGGYVICRLLAVNGYIVNPVKQGEVLAVIVLALLGIRLILKALKREFIQERRREALIVFDYIRIVIVSSFYTAAAGCAWKYSLADNCTFPCNISTCCIRWFIHRHALWLRKEDHSLCSRCIITLGCRYRNSPQQSR